DDFGAPQGGEGGAGPAPRAASPGPGRGPAARLLGPRREQRQGRAHAPGGGVRAVPDPRRPGHDAGPGRAAARIRRTAPDEDRGAVQALLRNRRLSVTPVTPAAAPVAGWRPLVR